MVEKQIAAHGHKGYTPQMKRPPKEWRAGDDWLSHYIILLMCSVALASVVLYGLYMAGQSYMVHAHLQSGSVSTGQASSANSNALEFRFTYTEDSSPLSSGEEHEPDCLKGTTLCDVKGLRFNK